MEPNLIAMHPNVAGYNGSHNVQHHNESFGLLGRLESKEAGEKRLITVRQRGKAGTGAGGLKVSRFQKSGPRASEIPNRCNGNAGGLGDLSTFRILATVRSLWGALQ
ncbi:hypothetical protein Plhal304r1_c039g0116181 [Plasmopara halstedii]